MAGDILEGIEGNPIPSLHVAQVATKILVKIQLIGLTASQLS